MEEDACFPEAHPSQWDGMWDGRSVDSKWQTQVIPRTAGSEEGPLQRASLRSRRARPERDAGQGIEAVSGEGWGLQNPQHQGEDAASPGPGWLALPQGLPGRA